MDLNARITELLNERGWTKYRLAKEANLSQSTIISMMKRNNHPTVETIEHCCMAFGISLPEFFDSDLQSKEFSLEERKLISDWRNLSPEMKNVCSSLISASKNNQNK